MYTCGTRQLLASSSMQQVLQWHGQMPASGLMLMGAAGGFISPAIYSILGSSAAAVAGADSWPHAYDSSWQLQPVQAEQL
jgi:hypothetical protein